MNKNLRLSERLYQRVLWCVAIVFAAFLIGLGRLVVGDMPHVEETLTIDSFLDTQAAEPISRDLEVTTAARTKLNDEIETKRLALTAAEQDVEQAQTSFRAWATTRVVTQRSENDPEVTKRVMQIDILISRQREIQRAVDELNQQERQLSAQEKSDQERLRKLHSDADDRYGAAQRKQSLRVFGWRLVLTLPLLTIAGWLVVRRRHSKYWPFVYGFAIFACFTFFVELVPYLPSYGGYVRYGVGVVGTLIGGQYLIRALTRYREKQRISEAQSEDQRRASLSYEMVMARLAKKVCPGCERPLPAGEANENFCQHCGMCLFNKCDQCGTHKNAFARFCQACGSTARRDISDSKTLDREKSPAQ